jgi:hypothetical protein
MDIRIIVFGMMGVLAVLFIGAKFFIPKEKNKGKKEALFAESVMAFKKTPSQETYRRCFEAAKELAFLKDKSKSDIENYLKAQGITFS